jgi:NTP pyrophosphatase (non-canonical NTP hydrolase)
MSDQIPYIQDPDEYQAWAEKTKSMDYGAIAARFGIENKCHNCDASPSCYVDWTKFKKMIDLLHGVIGMMTELGELADPLKKHIYYGKPLDEKNMREEIGDGFWYPAACLLPALQSSMSGEMTYNIRKLAVRYPDQLFTESDAIERKDKGE